MSISKTVALVFRRNLFRMLRLRNLIILTFVLIILYMVRNLKEMEEKKKDTPIKALLLGGSHNSEGVFIPASMKKKDWHNYEQMEQEEVRAGIGEQGKPAYLPKSDAAREEKLYAENGFNGALSDRIPLNRSLPDIRHKKCRKKRYLESLPTVSVVVPFHNEHWSTLLRTAYSVLNRSPKHLIQEILLVDDASTKDFLGKKLDDYLAESMPKVRVIRVANRSGLITARLTGAKKAIGDVIIFLDSHTEANVNWLPPLLEPIALNYKTVVCPFIDVIAYDTFEYRAQDEGARGAFDWEFFYKRLPVLPQDLKNMPEPFESPVMAGGLFAISRKFFWELGGYDPGLDIWGGEQYELSFKIWQCGGRMVDAPCSRVGHIYRKFAPFPNPGHGDFVGKNYRRVAEVWMDEYAEFLYRRRPQYRRIDTGDISEQIALRKKLQCKPFKWFMTQIAFDLEAKYPSFDPKPFAQGKIRTNKGDYCVDAMNGKQMDNLRLTACHKGNFGEQEWVFGWHKDIKLKTRNMCWDLPESSRKSPIKLYGCHLGGGNQLWRYHVDTKKIKHASGGCLDWDPSTKELFIYPCMNFKDTQQWSLDEVFPEEMEKWDNIIERITGPLPYNE